MTGSFHTMACQGVSAAVSSSTTGSTWRVGAGSGEAMSTMVTFGAPARARPHRLSCHDRWQSVDGRCQHGADDRPVRADDGRGRAGRRHRAAPLRVRAVRAPAAGRPPLRGGRRHRPAAGVDRAVPVRRTRSWRRSGDVVDDATLDWLADYRFSGDVDGYPEGELYFPGSPDPHRQRHVRRRGAAGDAGAVDPQPRQRGRLGRGPDGHRGGRPADSSRWARGAPTRPPRSPPPGPPTWPGSPPPPTWRPSAGTASRPPAPPRTPACCCTTTS